jgi:glycosyltransferase involved in cell wall biosynthesis
MQIFVASYSIPKPDISAGDRRFFEMLCLLARNHKVHLWTCEPEPQLNVEDQWRYRSALEGAGIKVLVHPAALDETLCRTCYDAGIFEFYWVAEKGLPLFRQIQPHAIVIIDTVDIAFSREELAVAVGVGDAASAAKTKQRELAIYRTAGAVIAISEEDRNLLLAEDSALQIGIVPIILPVDKERRDPASKQLIFVGGFNWPPNADGIIWFAREVLPLILKGEPDVVLNIVGSNPTKEIMLLASHLGIVVHGFVPETKPYLDRSVISVAPLRYGGGMKGKVIEAMAAGLPVVTTSIGSQGLDSRNGERFFVADKPDEFAGYVVSLLRDPVARVNMGKAAREYTASLCSPELAQKNLNCLLVDTSQNQPRQRTLLVWIKYFIFFNFKKVVRRAVPTPFLRQIRKALR